MKQIFKNALKAFGITLALFVMAIVFVFIIHLITTHTTPVLCYIFLFGIVFASVYKVVSIFNNKK